MRCLCASNSETFLFADIQVIGKKVLFYNLIYWRKIFVLAEECFSVSFSLSLDRNFILTDAVFVRLCFFVVFFVRSYFFFGSTFLSAFSWLLLILYNSLFISSLPKWRSRFYVFTHSSFMKRTKQNKKFKAKCSN